MRNPLLLASAFAACLFASCGTADIPDPDRSDAGVIDAGNAADADDQPDVTPPLVGLAESRVVCATCPPELLAAKAQGIQNAMAALVQFAGADIRPEHSPATFHLSGDAICGEYTVGTTGFCTADAAARAHLCLFDAEKQNRALPFTPENAVKPQDQLLAVHEALHAWFFDRVSNYGIEEPFCKITSFVISGALNGTNPDPCSWFVNSPGSPDQLMYHLCGLGMNQGHVSETLRRTAEAAASRNRVLTTEEFADIVTGVLGTETRPAFQACGLLP